VPGAVWHTPARVCVPWRSVTCPLRQMQILPTQPVVPRILRDQRDRVLSTPRNSAAYLLKMLPGTRDACSTPRGMARLQQPNWSALPQMPQSRREAGATWSHSAIRRQHGGRQGRRTTTTKDAPCADQQVKNVGFFIQEKDYAVACAPRLVPRVALWSMAPTVESSFCCSG
jgi:hypothetical protein